MKKKLLQFGLILIAALLPICSHAEYSYFYTSTGGSLSGSDGIIKDVRWPYWNSYYYNTWINDNWTSSDGVSGYFYNGLALPAAGSPNPVTTQQTVNWSFWPLSDPINISDTITPVWTSPNTFSMPTITEGTICRAPGLWSLWQTNVWYRMAIRTWQPVDGTPHLGYSGTWMRDPVAGVWYHMATIKLPMTVTGVTGSDGFQENASGGTQPQRTDYRNCYYHRSGTWNAASRFQAYNHAGATENAGLIENNTAVYYETCENNPSYTGTITNVGQYSPTFMITNQPAAPTFDPIIVTNYGATVYSNQLLVQWQIPAISSPQFAYKIEVYTNPAYTGIIATSFYDIDPEARQKLLNIGNVTLPYVKLTIIDIFYQTNPPIALTSTNASLNAAGSVTGTNSGLNFAYYQSASNIYDSGSGTNWAAMPNFTMLSPFAQGAVSGLDLTPRKRRNGYAFNYTGYLSVPTNGLYTFTLNSDDGSKLYIDGQLVINFDGEHSPSDLSGWIGLQAGLHSFNVQYFSDTQPTSLFNEYFDTLTLSYEGPGIAKTIVPTSAYFRTPTVGEPTISLSTPINGAIIPVSGVPLNASVTPNGATINKVQFYVGNTYWAQDATLPYSNSSFFWANNNNPIHARIFFNSTNILDSSVNLVTTTNAPLAPWQFGQIFYHNTPNAAAIQSGTYSIIGDGMNLLSRQVNGNCTFIAHLAGLPSTAAAPDGSSANTGWQAGIILRGNTNMVPGYPWGISGTAPFTAVFGQVDGGAYYQDETMVNGGGGYSANVGSQKWFKLQRTGNTFISSVSPDGTAWTAVKTNVLTDFPTTIYAGFFTYAGPSSNPNIHWASFDNVSLTGNLVGPPGVTINPAADTSYVGQSITLNASPSGNAPFYYQWQYNGVNLTGATNATLFLTNLQTASSALYSLNLSNANGTATANATVTILSAPPAAAQILSNNPVGYWQLNEVTGPTAYDSAGGYNGTGEGGIIFGVPGVNGAPFTGFGPDNNAAQFNGTDSDVVIPGFNFGTTNLTITGWVKCNGTQTSWSGLVFSRASGSGTGLMVDQNGNNLELRYSWNDDGNDYNYSTGLYLPTNNVWAFVALTIEPTRAIVYLATNSILRAATNNIANTEKIFNGSFYFGYDPNSSSRRINATLDEIAIYDQTLTLTQIGQILLAAQQSSPAVSLDSPASGSNFSAPANVTLNASVTLAGAHTVNYVQFFNGQNSLGISSNAPYSLTWTNVLAGTYTLFGQISYDDNLTANSTPAIITVNSTPLSPAAPTVTALASNCVEVGWSPATYATSYNLFRDGNWIATLNGTNYEDIGLAGNVNYCYSLVASNSYGSSSIGPASCITTPINGFVLAWDAQAAGAMSDGNGNWGTNAATWWNGLSGVTWANNALAIFGAGTVTNCMVILTNGVTPNGLIFNANNGGSYSLSSSGSGLLTLAGTPAILANTDVSISAPLSGGGLSKSGPGTLTITGNNTNTGAIIVSGGKLVSTGGGWYVNRSIGSGVLTVNNGAIAEFTQAHGFGYGPAGESATLNNGTLQFDLENYVSGLTMIAGTITGSGEFRTTGGIYNSLSSTNPSMITVNVNFLSGGTFNVVRGTAPVDLLASGMAYDTGAFTKTGSGIMAISGTWTNTGITTVNAGQLQVDGSLGTNSIMVQNTASLSGNGILGGAMTVSSGGTLAPGDNAIGTLTINNKLALNSGSKAVMELSKSGPALTNDLIRNLTMLTYGGSLIVTNIGMVPLAAGDSFTLFKAQTYGGTFNSYILPPLVGGLAWDTSKLTVNGSLTVYAAPPPGITGMTMSGSGFNLTGTGVVGQAYVLMSASNLAPPILWTRVLTNLANGSGVFNFTDPQTTNSAQRFYQVQ